MRKFDKVSVVLSFYNESAVLPELIKRLRLVFSDLIASKILTSYELIFVNDNSTDDSESYLMSELNYGDVVLINMSRNFGVSECVMAGMSVSDGDALIYMDSDLQDPPEVIPEMIKTLLADPDAEVVYTTRIRREGEHWLKLLITKYGYRFINKISDINLQIDSGDFKLLTRRVVNILLTLKEDKPYLRGLISWIGFKQVQVFYKRDERFDGRHNTKMPVLSKRVLYYWLDRALISFSDAPLKLMLFIGFAISFFSFLGIIIVLAMKIFALSVPGWAALMTVILFFSGIQILFLGLFGLYLGAIFRASKQRPGYVINEIIRK